VGIVVSVGDRKTVVDERTGMMIRWLVERDRRVQEVERGCISFSIAGKSVEAELKERERVAGLRGG
jgi:hypothetical protein